MFILIRPAYAVPFYGLAMLAFEVAMDHAQADPQLRLSNQPTASPRSASACCCR